MRLRNILRRLLPLCLLLAFLFGAARPLSAAAQEDERRPVRVGWFESAY